ncbi:MAG: GyrI-like domain-containing protein [Planctomycetota bacterium]|nr:GyrI-like domain-containing protein [Planctomycetota bacterium]
MIDTPQITQSPAMLVATLRLLVPSKEIMQHMGPGIQEVFAALGAQKIAPAGPWLTHHFRRPTDTFDFEICVPVKTPVKPVGRVKPGEIAASKVARTVYHGGYEGLGAGWGEFMTWIGSQKLNTREDLWECYLVGPESGNDSSKWRTELNRPLAG